MTSIKNGDVIAVLKRYKPASFDGCLTDPPYGLSFMGKAWDKGVPGVEVWAEVLRVLKPGAWLMAFGGSRTYHRLTCAIEDAGFEIRDCLSWLYGSGFPKGKGCLKPAWEPIILARKRAKAPVLNIDGCRIGTQQRFNSPATAKLDTFNCSFDAGYQGKHVNGRWPANVILDEHAEVLLEQSRFFYVAKASRRERELGTESLPLQTVRSGLGGKFPVDGKGKDRFEVTARNTHPTVKPIKLTEHLAKLILPAGESKRLLVPFSGSGSEMLGAKRAGWSDIVGIEISAEYKAIAEKRLAA